MQTEAADIDCGQVDDVLTNCALWTLHSSDSSLYKLFCDVLLLKHRIEAGSIEQYKTKTNNPAD